MASEFDQYARDYKEIIDRHAAVTGENFEFFIQLRVDLLSRDLAKVRAPAPLRILDFGCGIGATEQVLRERFPGAEIDGVDASPASLEAARALGVPGARFHAVTGPRLPFADASFDLVYSNGTFHHIPHDEHAAVLGELRRVLRPRANVFVFENNPLNPLMVRAMRTNAFDQGAKMLFPWYLRRLIGGARLRARAPRYYCFYPKQLKSLRWSEKHLRAVPLGAQYYVWGDDSGA
jgi:SAM-dependent methyltransferase